jgi:uncharacterized protein (TIGR02145 family)
MKLKIIHSPQTTNHSQNLSVMLIVLLFTINYSLLTIHCYSQVSINTNGANPNSSAMLDMSSTNSGFLINRMNAVQRNAIVTPAEGLLIFNVDNSCYEAYVNNTWYPVSCPAPCVTPSAFTAAAASPVNCNSFTAKWNASTGATGYNLDISTVNTFATFLPGYNNLNVGNTTSFAVSGLAPNTSYYYRLRAEPTCSGIVSSNTTIVTTPAACGPSCGSQVWASVNVNTGTMINLAPGGQNMHAPGGDQKYCYNNVEANCTTYGGLYEWAEAMNYAPSCDNSNRVQGICPAGYHIPSDLEWSSYEYCLENFLTPSGTTSLSSFQNDYGWRGSTTSGIGPGSKMKVTSNNLIPWDGTNSSSFAALPSGYRYGASNGETYNLGANTYIWACTEYSNVTYAWYRGLGSGNNQSFRAIADKKYGGLSVRCLMD